MEAVINADPSKSSMTEIVHLTLGILRCVPRDKVYDFHDNRVQNGKKGIFDVVNRELQELNLYKTLAQPADSIFLFISHTWVTPQDWPNDRNFETIKLDQMYTP